MENLNFLVVDDDKSTISNIRAILSKAFPNAGLLIAFNGKEAWELLQKNKLDIVIADYDLPEINGLDLCQKIRASKSLRHIYFIMITGYIDKELKIKALENCVDDFINEPFEYDDFISRLRAGVRVLKLQQQVVEENKLLSELAQALEKQISDIKYLTTKVISLRMPFAAELSKKVANGAVWIAKLTSNFDEEELQDIEFASSLVYVGKLCLPDELIEKPVMTNGSITHQLMCQVPLKAKELLENIGTFKNIANIIFHIWENFDGSGIPKKLQSWQIPAQSRIIRVVLDFEELRTFKKISADEALEQIKKESRRLYDPKVVLFLEQFLLQYRELEGSINEKPVQLQDLKEGLIISRDVYTYSGLKLLPAGVILNQKLIEMILSHNTTDPIIGNIWTKIN
ncbi:MAG: hypothetical protein CH6_3007 [Candidatus Kapaibacterium sp.]|nr:MAG: hypothetical protein CH6_3007 [Candidatus Kapabacteria bacterium]